MNTLQLRLQEPQTTVEAASEGLSIEARMVGRYAEINAMITQLEAEKKDISATLLDHYNTTGERASNGAQEVAIETRETWDYDVSALRTHMPDLFAKVAKVDSAKVSAAIKAGFVSASDLAAYRSVTVAQVLKVRAAK